jgi:N-acetylglucosamine-6-phosphate deacetylase
MQIISAEKIFTGNEWLTHHAIVVKNGKVDALVQKTEIPTADLQNTFDNCFIAPAFIDAQVYGAAKKLFAVYPEPETLALMNEEFLREGTCLFVPTLATNTADVFKKAIDAVKEYRSRGGKGVWGLHLEGPWLNEIKRGAHVREWIHSPTIEEVNELLKYGKGVIKMVTIAPEVCSNEVTDLLLSHNIVISAGHSNATHHEAVEAFGSGISIVTHLFNAMSPLHHREPGLAGATLNHSTVRASIIPDGHHVDYAAVAIAKKIMGSRLFAITDAVTETDSGPYRHQLAGDKYECNGVLSGSALSMYKAFKNLVEHAGVSLEESLRMCSLYPAQVLGCDEEHGKIALQASAQFIVLNKELELVEVFTS